MNSFSIKAYKIMESAPRIRKADPEVNGTMPIRASRYCQASKAATKLGWHVYPPHRFDLLWDGAEVFWRLSPAVEWMKLTRIFAPGVIDKFSENAPPVEDMDNTLQAPSLLEAFPENGVVQLSLGYIIQTSPGWNLLVRHPINHPKPKSYQILEGIVETDWWYGSFFVNFRITETNKIVSFSPSQPIAHIMPLPRQVFLDEVDTEVEHLDMWHDFGDKEWGKYNETFRRRNSNRPGEYMKNSKKTRLAYNKWYNDNVKEMKELAEIDSIL